MRLIKEDILHIDRYLIKKGIKYMDVRYELIDHLVSEYEAIENYPDLESFLRKRIAWCRMVADKKAKYVHWGYQKALLKRILTFFRNPVFYIVLLVGSFIVYWVGMKIDVDTLNKTLFFLFVSVIVLQFVDLFYRRIRSAKESKMLSVTTLFNIYSLPHFFIYFSGFLENQFEIHTYLGIIYFSIAILINVAALVEVHVKRERALDEYDFLKKHFV